MRRSRLIVMFAVVGSLAACGDREPDEAVSSSATTTSTSAAPASSVSVPESSLEAMLGCTQDGSYSSYTAVWDQRTPGEATPGDAVGSYLALLFTSFPQAPSTLSASPAGDGYIFDEQFDRVTSRSGGEGVAAFRVATADAGGYYVEEAAFCDDALAHHFLS